MCRGLTAIKLKVVAVSYFKEALKYKVAKAGINDTRIPVLALFFSIPKKHRSF